MHTGSVNIIANTSDLSPKKLEQIALYLLVQYVKTSSETTKIGAIWFVFEKERVNLILLILGHIFLYTSKLIYRKCLSRLI
jgi:hypothetical protein